MKNKIIKNRIKEFLLNTPEKYWFVIFGYHIHKSFLGTLFLVTGLIILILHSLFIGLLFLIVGTLLIFLSVKGHIYTNNKPYLKLWEKYKK